MFQHLRSSVRAVGVATALACTALLAACSESDPLAPGLGLVEADTVVRTLQADTVESSVGFAANRDGTIHARVCGPETTNFDAYLITRVRTETVITGTDTARVRMADTVARGNSSSNCEILSAPVTSGTFYRIAVRTVSGSGKYFACWAYDAAVCADLVPEPAPITGTGYYAGVNGQTGAALLAVLHNIVKTGYNGYEYDSARGHLYENVEDPDDNNLIEDLYVGRISTVNQRFNPNTTTDAGDANLNAEHTWPQSCGARLDRVTTNSRSTGPAGDLHIIFAADELENTRRSNYPFGNVVTVSTTSSPADSAGKTSRRGTNAQGVTVYEPRDEKKGDVARAIFYFYVRYVPEIPASLSLENFNIEEPVLLQWAAQDPPDAFERARNEEVFLVQGNRNPFIDHPEYLTAIGDFSNTVANTRATCTF